MINFAIKTPGTKQTQRKKVYLQPISSLSIPESGPPEEIAPFWKINKKIKMAEAILRRKAEIDKNKKEQNKI